MTYRGRTIEWEWYQPAVYLYNSNKINNLHFLVVLHTFTQSYWFIYSYNFYLHRFYTLFELLILVSTRLFFNQFFHINITENQVIYFTIHFITPPPLWYNPKIPKVLGIPPCEPLHNHWTTKPNHSHSYLFSLFCFCLQVLVLITSKMLMMLIIRKITKKHINYFYH